jgi:hypothetical protein
VDLNVRAFQVVQEAISGVSSPASRAKTESSRKGGLKGGRARARSMSRERRLEIAKKANAARWQKGERS